MNAGKRLSPQTWLNLEDAENKLRVYLISTELTIDYVLYNVDTVIGSEKSWGDFLSILETSYISLSYLLKPRSSLDED